MDRSIAEEMMSPYHEAINIRQNGSYNDADNQKSKSTAIHAPQEIQSHVHGLAAPDTPYTASVRV